MMIQIVQDALEDGLTLMQMESALPLKMNARLAVLAVTQTLMCAMNAKLDML